jgi:hypothetical protein
MANSAVYAKPEIDHAGVPLEHPYTLDRFAVDPGCIDGISVQSLEAGSMFLVTTRHHDYRFVVVDAAQQRALITGGSLFPESTEIRVEGATTRGSVVKIGWIGIGLPLEMSMGRRRIITSRVQSITFEHEPSSRPALVA